MNDQTKTDKENIRRLHIWLGFAAGYVERYTRLRPNDANAQMDLKHMRELLSEIEKTNPSLAISRHRQ